MNSFRFPHRNLSRFSHFSIPPPAFEFGKSSCETFQYAVPPPFPFPFRLAVFFSFCPYKSPTNTVACFYMPDHHLPCSVPNLVDPLSPLFLHETHVLLHSCFFRFPPGMVWRDFQPKFSAIKPSTVISPPSLDITLLLFSPYFSSPDLHDSSPHFPTSFVFFFPFFFLPHLEERAHPFFLMRFVLNCPQAQPIIAFLGLGFPGPIN